MKILFIGDIFGETGKRAIKNELNNLKKQLNIDYVIANGENVTDCKGLNIKDYHELVSYGIDFFTMGNHTWGHDEIFYLLRTQNNIIRPYNIDPFHKYGQYGVGTKIVKVKNMKLRITNLIGNSIKLKNCEIINPFFELDKIIKNCTEDYDIHIVDFHAESSGEKSSLFFDFKNKVTAIFGTHTHIQTSDNQILNNTAFITDVGSTGSSEGILGAKPEFIVDYFRKKVQSFQIKDAAGKYRFCGVVLEINDSNKKIISFDRICINEN